jgi:quercetin dioxygenase-like cupin family protein
MNSRKEESLPESTLEHIALAIQPAELSAQQRDRMRARVLQTARETSPEGTTTQRATAAKWLPIAPFVEVRELWRDELAGTHLSLLRMRPGGIVPGHRHSKDEDFIVLEGECHIGALLLCAGDAHRATAGSIHGDVTTRTGVTVLLRGEFPYPAPHR